MADRWWSTRRTRVLVPLALTLAALLPAAALSQSAPPATPKPVTILALGDSLTAGFGLASADGFTAKLEAALKANGINARIVNAGLSGDTSAGGLARLAWALEPRPDFAILELGANDGLRGLSPKAMEANLDAILAKLKARNVRVLLAGMRAPRNLGREYAEEFDGVFARLAQKHDAVLYPFFLDGVATDPAFNQSDGLHPNAAGVDVIVRRILPYVKQLIGAG